MDLSISVVIRSHNPRPEFLARALEALRAQRFPAESWELLLIDNASEPPLAGRFDLSWKANARVVREERLGGTVALMRGFEEAAGALIVVVDDDNLVAPDYLEVARALADGWPRLGVWSGRIDAEYQAEPPPWLGRYEIMLAIRRQEREAWSNLVGLNPSNPVGAGMCIRRELARAYAAAIRDDPRRQALGPRGGALSRHEDTDLAFFGCARGWGMGVFPQLRLTHIIPPERLRLEYLARLMEEGTRSEVHLMHLHGQPAARLPLFFRLRSWLAGLRLPPAERALRRAQVRGLIRGYRDLEAGG
jgi:glycosyltransferase involved in cell wall biosynthesis